MEADLSASPLLSLVVATKGRPSPFEVLFRSLEAQSFRDFEVIVVDQNADGRIGTPEAEGTMLASAHRGLMRLRDAVSKGDIAVVDEAERGDQLA